MLFTNTVFNTTVLGTTSMLRLLLFPQMTQEYNKIGNVCIDMTLKRVRITTVAMEKQTYNAQRGHAIQEHHLEKQ
jgi:hypothetical protein